MLLTFLFSIQHATGLSVWIDTSLLRPVSGETTDLLCQVTYTRRVSKIFLVLGTVPVERKEKEGQHKRAQRRRQNGKAAQQARHRRTHPDDQRQDERQPGRHKTTPREPVSPKQFSTFSPCTVLGSAPFVSWRSLAHSWYFWTNEGVSQLM